MTGGPWPLPGLLAWSACWLIFLAARHAGAPLAGSAVAAALSGALFAVIATTTWRRVFVAAGFPVSFAAAGLANAVPAWAWLVPMAALAFVYPLHAWRDAPIFPTPEGALRGLGPLLGLVEGARVVDAGCGVGSALVELRREFPDARFTGIEFSRPIAWLCDWRCRFATVRRADMWEADWSAFDLVYLFQRPESMPRAADKAARELRPGAWLASLEFEVDTLRPSSVFVCADARLLWLYRAPFRVAR